MATARRCSSDGKVWRVEDWLALEGISLVNVYQRAPDAEFILDGGDPENNEWFYAEVSEGMFPPTAGQLVDEERRNPSILKWVEQEHRGDWLAALRQSPLLVLVEIPKHIYLMDGWHRLKLARANRLTTIPVCFAYSIAHRFGE